MCHYKHGSIALTYFEEFCLEYTPLARVVEPISQPLFDTMTQLMFKADTMEGDGDGYTITIIGVTVLWEYASCRYQITKPGLERINHAITFRLQV